MGRRTIDYVLCEECEQRFNKRGEEWITKNCSLAPGVFPLREHLSKRAPELKEDSEAFYSTVDIPEIDSEKIVYFALSVFWRAAAHRWLIGKRLDMPISLGPYEEALRLFLLDRAPVPADVHLVVWVSSLPNPYPVGGYPWSQETQRGLVHYFNIPGMEFTLKAGRRVEEFYPFMSFLNPEKRPLMLGKYGEHRTFAQIIKYYQATHVVS